MSRRFLQQGVKGFFRVRREAAMQNSILTTKAFLNRYRASCLAHRLPLLFIYGAIPLTDFYHSSARGEQEGHTVSILVQLLSEQ